MRLIAMRSTLTAAGLAGFLGIAIAACGGGGSSPSTPATVPNPTTSAPSLPTVNTVSGPTAPMTIVIKLPTGGQAPAGTVRASALANARTLANTSPFASVRAAGASIVKARASAAGTTRTPQYVSPASYFMELVLASGGNSVYDNVLYCPVSAGQCTATFQVPVGTNYTVSLFLYSYYGYLLSAGSTTAVDVTTAGPNSVTVTLNGVAEGFAVSPAQTYFYQDASSQPSPFNVTVTPIDAEDNYITTPGTAMDNTFKAITSYNMSVSTYNSGYGTITDTDLLPATSVATPDPTLVATQSYTFSGSGSERYIIFNASPVTSGPVLVANSGSYYYDYAPNSGSTSYITDYPVTLAWTNPEGYDGPYSSPSDPAWETPGGLTVLEFPTLNNATYNFGITATANGNTIPVGGNVTFSVTNCTGVLGSTPSTASYSSLQSYPYVGVALAPTNSSNSCYVTATDSANRAAYLYIKVDKSTLTIQSTTRKH